MTEQSQNNISHTNSYLKNLSQKKYAWMEEAAASIKPMEIKPQQQPRKSTVTKKNTKKRPSSPSTEESPKRSKPAKQSSKLTQVQSSEKQEEQQPQETKRYKQPRFKYTNFPVKGYHILPTRNITSHFARADTSFIQGNKAGSESILPQVRVNSH